jgi:NAD(P)H-dependent flavin oxidoreductase YrpB (nitropropane dioxygenase family)
METFQLIALTPPGLLDPSIAIAASRAGGLGVLDLELVQDEQPALDAIARLVRYAKKGCGIKIDGRDEDFLDLLMTDLPEQIEVVILTHADPDRLDQHVKALHDRNITVLLETTCLEQALLGVKAGVNGVIAKGNEAGGWVGEETTFILLQRLLSQTSLPVYAQGGIGVHTAAACYAAGAAGVLLDSQLTLTRESTLPQQAKEKIRRMDGSELRLKAFLS